MRRFLRWFLALWVTVLRTLRLRTALADAPRPLAPRRCDVAAGLDWARCSSCSAELGSVWRYQDASYCRACHRIVSSDSDSSSSGAFSD